MLKRTAGNICVSWRAEFHAYSVLIMWTGMITVFSILQGIYLNRFFPLSHVYFSYLWWFTLSRLLEYCFQNDPFSERMTKVASASHYKGFWTMKWPILFASAVVVICSCDSSSSSLKLKSSGRAAIVTWRWVDEPSAVPLLTLPCRRAGRSSQE